MAGYVSKIKKSKKGWKAHERIKID